MPKCLLDFKVRNTLEINDNGVPLIFTSTIHRLSVCPILKPNSIRFRMSSTICLIFGPEQSFPLVFFLLFLFYLTLFM